MGNIESEKTIAILVGIEDYQNKKLHKLPASFNNVSDLMTFLVDKKKIRTENIKKLISCDYERFLDDIENFIEDKNNIDNIIFYYAGHALPVEPSNNGVEYYITASNTDPENNRTKISCRELFKSLKRDNAANLIAIFDSCFSGNVYDNLPSKTNSFVLSSIMGDNFATYPLNNRNSLFTEKFIHVLNNGIPNNKENLSLRDILQEVSTLLEQNKQPVPTGGGVGPVGDLLFIENFEQKAKETKKIDYDKELTDLYVAIADVESKFNTAVSFNGNKASDKTVVKNEKSFNKLFANDVRIEDENHSNPENFNNSAFRKSLILKKYPIVISYLLKQFLNPDYEKKFNDEFYGNIYNQVLKLLCFIVIKDLADHKNLGEDYISLLEKIWGPVDHKWYFDVLSKGVNKYNHLLLIEELSKNAPFFENLLFIEYKKFESIKVEDLEEIYGSEKGELLRSQFENATFDFRTALIDLIKNLSFFAKYNMIAIKLIKVVSGYCQPVSFMHDVSNLNNDSPQGYTHKLITKNKCYHNGTVIILAKDANPEEVLENEKYISLWPLIIDKNGSHFDTTKEPEIHLLQHAEKDSLTFYYRIATEEKEMFSGIPKRYNDLIQFPTLDEKRAYFVEFKKRIGLNDENLQTTEKSKKS